MKIEQSGISVVSNIKLNHIQQDNQKKYDNITKTAVKFLVVDGIPVVQFKNDKNEIVQMPEEDALKEKRIQKFLTRLENDLFNSSSFGLSIKV